MKSSSIRERCLQLNPELCRNLWLEITPLRLIVMPVILALLLYLGYIMDEEEGFRGIAIFLAMLLGLVWATRQAAESIMGEMRDRTWEMQRMSDISPLQMVSGKLFGSTIYQWYGLALLLPVLIATDSGAFLLLALTLFSICFTLLLTLHFTAGERNELPRGGNFLFLSAGVILAFTVYSVINSLLESNQLMAWFGLPIDSNMIIISLLFFALLFSADSYRILRLELRERAPLWSWPLLITLVALWFIGFNWNIRPGASIATILNNLSRVAAIVTLVYGFAIYLLLVIEVKSGPVFQRALHSIVTRRLFRPEITLPLWLITLPLYLIALAIFILLQLPLTIVAEASESHLGFIPLAIGATTLLLRDIAIFLWFYSKPGARRPGVAVAVSMLLLHGLLPAILYSLELTSLTALFWAVATPDAPLALIGMFVQLIAITVLVARSGRLKIHL